VKDPIQSEKASGPVKEPERFSDFVVGGTGFPKTQILLRIAV